MREEKRGEIIQDALQYLDEDLIENVDKIRGGVVETDISPAAYADKESGINSGNRQKERATDRVKKEEHIIHAGFRSWRKWAALAASVCVLVAVSWIFDNDISPFDKEMENPVDLQEDVSNPENMQEIEGFGNQAPGSSNNSLQMGDGESNVLENQESGDDQWDGISGMPEVEMAETIEIPRMELSLKKETDAPGDMAGFFIYESRCYVQNEYIRTGTDCVGDYVGTATGLIDEWTKKDGYVDFAGSISGKFYEVKGMDPDFMLCMVWENGVVETYINNTGISLSKGSDLVEDRLNLKEQYTSVAFFTDEEWRQYETKKQPEVLPAEHKALFDRFIDSFAEGSFQFVKDTPLNGNGGDGRIYHLYFTTEDDVVLHFWLLGDGYVAFQGLNQVCVQIDEEIYEEVLAVLQG